MTKQDRAQKKRERRVARGPGFSLHAKRNVSEEAEGLRSKRGEWRKKYIEAAQRREKNSNEKRTGVFERMFGA